MRKLYWLDDEAWAKIEAHLPRGRRGARRVDDRGVISGIIPMRQSGARWRDCPQEYGPYTTIYNRFNRWSRQGVWQDVFKALTGLSGVYFSAAIDSTSIKAHHSAAGAKDAGRRRLRPCPRADAGWAGWTACPGRSGCWATGAMTRTVSGTLCRPRASRPASPVANPALSPSATTSVDTKAATG